MGVGGQNHVPAALPQINTRYPLYRRLDGPQRRSGRVRKTSSPSGFDPWTVQRVASRFTDWAIAANENNLYINKIIYFETDKEKRKFVNVHATKTWREE
jgi:hypothetical protein